VHPTLPLLAQSAKVVVNVFGFGWKESEFAARSVIAEGVPNSDLPEVHSSHSVSLSEAWPSMNEAGIISNHVFDGAASAALVVIEKISGNHPVLDSVLNYGSTDDLAKITSQLGDPALEEEARESKTLVADNNNSVLRAKRLDELLQELHP
jgi:hypothetical protein